MCQKLAAAKQARVLLEKASNNKEKKHAKPKEADGNRKGSDDRNDSDDDTEMVAFEEALARKEQGNAAFREAEYKEAIEYYMEAWNMFEEVMILGENSETYGELDPAGTAKAEKEIGKVLANIAECYLRLENWAHAAASAQTALEFDSDNGKAHYRLAKAHFHLKHYLVAMMHASRVENEEGEKLLNKMKQHLLTIIEKNRDMFRRIIDSYRLRVEDEYTHTGDISRYSLYGLAAEGQGEAIPMKQFRAYVRLGVKKGVIMSSLLPENDTLKFEALSYMAITDKWANICYAVEKHDIEARYKEAGISDSVSSLRTFANSIVGHLRGPFDFDGETEEDIMDYFSDEEEETY